MKLPSAFLCFAVASLLHAQEPALRIVVTAGEGALNNINQKVNIEPAVEVRDQDRKPVEGAAVVFFLPAQGPSGTFSNGSQTLTATTDHQGRAVARGIQYNRQTGPFTIRVTASAGGQTATINITQTNVSGVSTSGGGGGFSTKAWIILGASAAAVAGVVIAATHHGSGGSSSSGPVPIVITPGIPSVGGPGH